MWGTAFGRCRMDHRWLSAGERNVEAAAWRVSLATLVSMTWGMKEAVDVARELAAAHARHRDVSWYGPCVRGHRPGGYIIDAGPIRLLAPRPRGSSSDPARTDLRVALRVREATRVSGHEGCHGRAGVNRRQLKSPSRLLRARVSGLSSRSHEQIRWAGRETLVAVCKKRIERAMSSLT